MLLIPTVAIHYATLCCPLGSVVLSGGHRGGVETQTPRAAGPVGIAVRSFRRYTVTTTTVDTTAVMLVVILSYAGLFALRFHNI